LPYGVAIGSTAIALLLTLSLAPSLTQSVSVFFFVSITISTWYGGLRPGFVAIVLSTLAINAFLVPPLGQFTTITTRDVIRLATFCLVAVVIHLLSDHLRNSKRRVEQLSQQLLEESAEQLRIALSAAQMAVDERQQAQERLQQQFEQQRLVMEMTQRIRRSLNLQDILQTTVDEVRQFLQCDRVIIFQFSPGWGGTVVVESVADEWMPILPLQIYDPCIGEEYVEPFKQGLVTAKADIYHSGISPCHIEFLASLQVRANLVVPIFQGEELWGLLAAHHCAAPREWQSSEIVLLRQLGAQVSVALQQSELFGQVQTELAERKQAEATLREREAILRLFAQYAPAGIAMLDGDMRYLMASQRWVDEHYLDSIESLINRSHYEVFPEIPERWRQIHQRCLAGAIEKSEADLFVRADGTEQWISWEIHPWHRATHEIGGIIIFAIDITQRKQTEAALRESQLQIQRQLAEIETIYQSAPIGLNVLDTELRFVRINQRLAEINGLPVEAHIGRTLRELLPDLADAAEQLLHPILETGEPLLNVEISGETPAQPGVQRIWLESFLPLKDGDRIIGISTVCEEITDRKLAEMALVQLNCELEQRVADRTAELTQVNDRLLEALATLSESEERRRLALDLTHIGFWDWHLPSRTLIWNDNHFTLLGLAPDTIEPNYELWRNHVHPDDMGWAEQQFLESIENRTDYAAEYRVVHPDGSVHWLMARARAIYDESGQAVRSLGVLLDISDRKRAEETLQQYERIISNTKDGIALMNRHYIYQVANQGYLSWCNKSAHEVIGNSVRNILGEKLFDNFIQPRLDRCLAGETIQYEKWFDYPNLVPEFLSVTYTPYRDTSENISGVIVSLRDLTRLKQAEATLQQQARQEQLLWNITQSICQTLELNAILNTTVTEVRQTLQVDRAVVYRFNPDWSGNFVVESVSNDWVKLVKFDIQKVWKDTYLQETQGGRFRNHESFVIADIYTAGLEPCHIELLEQFQAKAYAVAPIFSGEVLWGLLAIYQNATPRHWQSWEVELLQQITSQLSIAIQQSELYRQLQIELHERKQAAAVLREAERRWRSLLDNVQLIVVGLDKTGAINYVNPFFLSLTGYTQQEVVGKNWFENFLPLSSQQSIQTVFSEVLTHNPYPYYQNSILTKSGEERFIAWNNTMLQDSVGTTIGTISIGEDITERQKVEQMKNEFIGIVSHELRTPLTAIKMSLGLLKSGIYDKKPDKFQRMLEIALIDTHRLMNLVNDILDLERLESGRAVLEKMICQAADLMQKAVDGVQPLATPQQITFTIVPTDAQVWASTDTILQTLTNLLSNAVKFSSANSTITLSAEYQTDVVLFQVSDRGRGIPADKLEAIFGRFQQVDVSDARQKGGTGLGLAICRSIIEQHGGKIWAESTLGEGSTFLFTLPLPPQEMV